MVQAGGKNRTDIGARLRKLRRDMTQARFAELVGVAQGQVAKYEKGMLPGPNVLLNISRAMGVTIEWILCGEEENLPGRGRHSDVHPPKTPGGATAGESKDLHAQVHEMRDAMETAPARELGMQAERKIDDDDQADFAAGHIMDTKLPRYEAQLLGDLVRDSVRDREVRQKVLDFYLFLRFQKENEPKDEK